MTLTNVYYQQLIQHAYDEYSISTLPVKAFCIAAYTSNHHSNDIPKTSHDKMAKIYAPVTLN
jgi:hypothetical protein